MQKINSGVFIMYACTCVHVHVLMDACPISDESVQVTPVDCVAAEGDGDDGESTINESEDEIEIQSDTESSADPAGLCEEHSFVVADTHHASGQTVSAKGPNDISDTFELGATRPMLAQFPRHKIDNVYRSFQKSFYDKYEWVEYSIAEDSVFCFHCRHFPNAHHSSTSFTHTGFRNWKKCYGPDPKDNRLLQHQRSVGHQASVAEHAEFLKSKTAEDSRKSVLSLISDAHSKEVMENRHYMKTLCEILCLTAGRRIAQRENTCFRQSDIEIESLDFGANSGNFLAILGLVAKHDDIVKRRLQSGPQNAKYTHHSVQTSLLRIMSELIIAEISSEVSKSTFYTILADETKDLSKKEQMSIVLRYVYEGSIHEQFVNINEAKQLDADGLTATILDAIDKMTGFSKGGVILKNCVGQGYDGANVMSGHLNGVNVKLQNHAPFAHYVHCFNHRLNLVLVDVVKSIPCCSETLSLLQRLYVFISSSAVHPKWVEMQKEQHVRIMELKSLSDTRWACQANMISAVCKRLQILVSLLADLADHEEDPDRRITARGLFCQVDKQFLRNLFGLRSIFSSSKTVSDFLQSSSNNLADAVDLINNFRKELQEMRSEEKLQSIWDEVETLSQELGVPERKLCRQSKMPARFEDSYVEAPIQSTRFENDKYVAFKRDISAAIDKVQNEVDRRFSKKNESLMRGISSLTPESPIYLEANAIKDFGEEYSPLIDTEDIDIEVNNLRRILKKMPANNRPQSLLQLQTYVERLNAAYPELDKMLRIACTLPVSTSACERSFSTLRIVKNYLRTTMTNARLNDLLVIGIHRGRAARLDLDEVIDIFIKKHPKCRIKLQ